MTSACCSIARGRRNSRRRRPRRSCRRPKLGPAANDLDIRVIARAGRSEIAGLRDGAVLIRLAAAPVDGAANGELIALLSKALKVPKRDITIVSGERSRTKRIRIAGVDRDQALAKLIV